MLSSQVKFSADRQTDRRTPVKQYGPDLLMRGHKKVFELSPLTEWIALWIDNTYSEFQVTIFSNNRNITRKCCCLGNYLLYKITS